VKHLHAIQNPDSYGGAVGFIVTTGEPKVINTTLDVSDYDLVFRFINDTRRPVTILSGNGLVSTATVAMIQTLALTLHDAAFLTSRAL
jgi:hypothetical protein